MKAITFHTYGSPEVLRLVDIEKPVPAENEVLVQVRASSVNPAEWYAMTGLFIARLMGGLSRPKETRLGADFAGVVEAVGANVTDFHPGDEVFGGRTGAFAEYVCVRNAIALKPGNITFEQAASVPTAAITALQGLRDHGHIRPGSKVLINGASGGVGTFAVQIAKAFGAEVTGVCSTANIELVRSLGADHVIDYAKEDFTLGQARYDLVLDNAGGRSWSEFKRVLTSDAVHVIVGAAKKTRVIGPLSHVIRLKAASLFASQKVVFFVAKFNRADLALLAQLMQDGKLTPVVDRVYKLGETSEAMRYLGTGHAKAKVVVTMNSSK
ncbi:MAG: NAD(P)-dependent alcohol dehydrogenase [Anaerolineales bacterium]